MSTIHIQELIVGNDTDIGLTSDLINGTDKSSSSTDLSNNVYSKINDFSNNVCTQLNNKQPTLTALTHLSGTGSNITAINYNNTSLNKPNLTDLQTYVYGSLNTIYNTLSIKQNNLTFTTPSIKDVSNNVTIDLSASLLLSSNQIIQAWLERSGGCRREN
jgi:hypothetical protein